jgi:hypothetical protein
MSDSFVNLCIVNGIFLVVTLGAIKMMLNSALKEFKAQVKELWTAINKHGHKGLDMNGSRVTRG